MKTIIIGAGMGGMALACRLAAGGADVEIYEKNGQVGGRLGSFEKQGFRFDTGPTSLLMPWVLRRLFSDVGKRLEDYLALTSVEPIFRIYFRDGSTFTASSDRQKMLAEIRRTSEEDAKSYLKFMEDWGRQEEVALSDFLQRDFDGTLAALSPAGLRSFLSMGGMRTLYEKSGEYFTDPRVRAAVCVQSMFLGASPDHLPALYGFLPYSQLSEGEVYPMGGLYAAAEALEKLCGELGAKIYLQKGVQEIHLEGNRATGVVLRDGTFAEADAIVSDADLAYTYLQLIKPEGRRHMDDRKIASLEPSCSVLTFYFGLDGNCDLPHHCILFPENGFGAFKEVFEGKIAPQNPVIYLSNPCANDPSLAPEGKSVLYAMVPVPNLSVQIDWEKEVPKIRQKVLEHLSAIGFPDLEKRVEAEAVSTPEMWRDTFNLDLGAAFGLLPSLRQTGALRPQCYDRKIKGLYFVGASTHPGGSVPLVLLSAELAERRIMHDASALEEKEKAQQKTEHFDID